MRVAAHPGVGVLDAEHGVRLQQEAPAVYKEHFEESNSGDVSMQFGIDPSRPHHPSITSHNRAQAP